MFTHIKIRTKILVIFLSIAIVSVGISGYLNYNNAKNVFYWLLGLFVIILIIAIFFSKSITQPIRKLTDDASQLEKGNLDIQIQTQRHDEIGALAESIGSVQKSLKNFSKEKKLLENTLESLTYPFYVVDPDDYTVKLANSAAKRLATTDISTCHAMSHRRDKPCNSKEDPCPLEIVKKTKKPVALEHIHYDENGNRRYVEVHGYPILDNAGNVDQMIEYSIDITKRKEAQKVLADQLAFTQALVDTVPNPIFVKGPDTRFITFNRAYEEAFGMKREDYIGKTTLDLDYISPDAREHFQEEDSALLKTGGEKYMELGITYADAKIHNVLYWVRTFELSGGELGGLLGVLVDISELKRLERELQKAYDRMKDELDIGREIQMSMLPLTFPAFPDRNEFAVYANLEPAREVGGDFYDFYFLDDDHFCFCIGDVSGKGVPSALFMAVAKTLIKSRATEDYSTASILTHVNDELNLDNKASMFVTIFLCILNIKTGVLIYTNAGHNPPYILREHDSLQKLSNRHGPVIGAVPGMTYKEDVTTLTQGDMVLLYTDGITEAMDASNTLFTEKRLVDLLACRSFESVKDIVNATLDEVKQFQGNAEQADDITIIAVKHFGQPEAQEAQAYKVTIKNQITEIDRLNKSFNVFAENIGIPNTDSQKINLVFDELLNNIMTYAYQDEVEHDIEVKWELSGDRLTVTIADDGIPFNPFGTETPDTALSLEEREVGGLGIHLVRNVMDKVLYQRHIDKNVVTLTKRFTVNHNS